MEEEVTNFKSMATVLWVALITAVIVTIIDWKLKQDILRLTDAFYRVYPATMEQQNASTKQSSYSPNNRGRPGPDPVLPFPVVGYDARMEAEVTSFEGPKDPEDHSSNWAQFAPGIATGLEPKPAEDS